MANGINLQRFNPIKQASALMQLLRQGGQNPFIQDLGVGEGPRSFDAEKLLNKKEPAEAQPTQPTHPQQFTDANLKFVSKFDGDTGSAEIYKDTFGNEYLSFLEENGETRTLLNFSSKGDAGTKHQANVQAQNKKVATLKDNIIKNAKAKGAVQEFEDFTLRSVKRIRKAKTAKELFNEENLKRSAFNLEPLDKIPVWINEEAAKQRPEIVLDFVLTDKQTGKDTVLINQFNAEDFNVEGRSSSELLRTTNPDLFDPSAPLESVTEQTSALIKAQNYLSANTPHELKGKLKSTLIKDLRAKEVKLQFSDSTIHVSGEDGTFKVNVEKELKESLAAESGFSFPNPQQPQQLQAQQEATSRFNVPAQARALPEFLRQTLGIQPNETTPLNKTLLENERFMNVKAKVFPSLVKIRQVLPLDKPVKETSLGAGSTQSQKTNTERPVSGSGFILEGGIIVTNEHVVRGFKDKGDITIIMSDGSQVTPDEIIVHPTEDLAIFKVNNLKGQKSMSLAKGVIPGEFAMSFGLGSSQPNKVTTAGNVNSLQENVTQGIFGGALPLAGKSLFTSADVVSGKSGGPLVNEKGEVVGINTKKAPNIGGTRGVGGINLSVDLIRDFVQSINNAR